MIDLSRNVRAIDHVPLTHNRILSGIRLISNAPGEAPSKKRKSKLERLIMTMKTDKLKTAVKEYQKV